jgi:hypothetical protein
MLRDYINKMAINIILREHPWGRIHQLISMLDAESLEQVIIQSWKCIIDAFDKVHGPSSISFIGSQLQFISIVHRGTDLVEQERLIRGLITHCEVFNVSILQPKVRLVLGYNLTAQRRYPETEELGWDLLSRAQEQESDGDKITNKREALELISYSQYYQHRTKSAEKNLRGAIAVASDRWGSTEPSVIRNMIYLEVWLREWGRKEEADRMKEERVELIGRDDVDEQIVE